MHIRDTLAQLAGLHDPACYAWILRAGVWFTNHTVYCTPPCSTRTAQQCACVTSGEAPHGRYTSVCGQIIESVTASCRLAAMTTPAERSMGLPRRQEVPA